MSSLSPDYFHYLLYQDEYTAYYSYESCLILFSQIDGTALAALQFKPSASNQLPESTEKNTNDENENKEKNDRIRTLMCKYYDDEMDFIFFVYMIKENNNFDLLITNFPLDLLK